MHCQRWCHCTVCSKPAPSGVFTTSYPTPSVLYGADLPSIRCLRSNNLSIICKKHYLRYDWKASSKRLILASKQTEFKMKYLSCIPIEWTTRLLLCQQIARSYFTVKWNTRGAWWQPLFVVSQSWLLGFSLFWQIQNWDGLLMTKQVVESTSSLSYLHLRESCKPYQRMQQVVLREAVPIRYLVNWQFLCHLW